MKKKTQKKASTIISDCNFIGVKYDKDSMEPLLLVTKALLNITELYKGQNIQIDSLINIGKKE